MKLYTQSTIEPLLKDTEGARRRYGEVGTVHAALGGLIATINHHPSADLRAAGGFLRGAAGRYCTQFLSDSLRPAATEAAASSSAPDPPPRRHY